MYPAYGDLYILRYCISIYAEYSNIKKENNCYTKDGSLLEKTEPSGDTLHYDYDTWGNITQTSFNGTVNTSNLYDTCGRLKKRVDVTGVTTYDWNTQGQLINISHSGKENLKYQYDTYGNLISLTYPDNTTVTYSYDKKNRMIEKVAMHSQGIKLQIRVGLKP